MTTLQRVSAINPKTGWRTHRNHLTHLDGSAVCMVLTQLGRSATLEPPLRSLPDCRHCTNVVADGVEVRNLAG